MSTEASERRWTTHDARLERPGPVHVRRDGPDGKRIHWETADGGLGLGEHRLEDLLYLTNVLWLAGAGDPFVLAEGESSADAIAATGAVAVATVCGAASTPGEAVIRLLAKRPVVLWRDADQVGFDHMARIGRELWAADVPALYVVRPPADVPAGWDAADATPAQIQDLVDAALERGPIPPYEPALAEPETLSPDVAPERGRNLQAAYLSARDIVAETPAVSECLVRDLVYVGALHELVGRAKAAGKTTFELLMIRAILDGVPFLERPSIRTPVVLLTEQAGPSLRAALTRTGLADREDLVILRWADAQAASWETIVDSAIATCHRIGARALFVDTLPQFARIRGDAENDAGAALAAIEPLQAAAARGLAVFVVRHERKGGGDVGDSARGSSAFTGAVDVVLRLGRPDNPPRPTIRNLSTLSRFDETPPELVIELTDEGYVSLGDQAEVAFAEARREILDVLPDAPSAGMTEADLIAQVGGRKTTVGAALRALLSAGDVVRSGEGRRGSPYVYTRVAADPGFVSPAPSGRGGGRKQFQPVSVSEEMAAIFRPDDEPDDVDEPDPAVLDRMFAAPSWPN